jgi:hypothetical protein
MLFKRKNKQSLWSKTREIVWPRAGWSRTFRYVRHRVLRLPHSTRDIAMGLAAGCVVSWTPTWGIQILQCLVFCKITRANFLASVIGTLFGNPWTFPILIWISYIVGAFFLEVTGLEDYFMFLSSDTVVHADIPADRDYHMPAFIPTLVGGYMMAVLTFPLFYYSFYYMIKAARAAKTTVGAKVHVIGEKVHTIKEHRQGLKQVKQLSKQEKMQKDKE